MKSGDEDMIEIELDTHYKCANCKEEFEFIRDETWSEESAKEEYEKTFGEPPSAATSLVCDDCYEKIMRYHDHPIGVIKCLK